MANKTLTARVRLDTKQCETKLDSLVKKINNINRTITRTGNNSSLSRAIAQGDKAAQRLAKSQERNKRLEYELWWQTQLVNQEYRKAHPLIAKLSDKLKINTDLTYQWGTATSGLLQKLNSTKSSFGGIWTKLKSILGLYAGVQGANWVLNTSDNVTRTKNQLNNLDGGSQKQTQGTMDKVYAAAQRSRTSYSGMLSDVGKLMTLATDSFQGNTDNAIRFQEIMAKSYALGNMSAEEQSTSMYQLVQALGSGTLQGDELRSVREGASLMYDEMEKNFQEILKTDKSLKDLAADGLITSDMVVWAVMKAGDKIDDKFKKTKMTWDDVCENIRNKAEKAFERVSTRLEEVFNSKRGKQFLEDMGIVLLGLADAVLWVVDVFVGFFNFCVENWGWLKHVIVGALITMITWTLIKAGISIFCAYQEMKAWMAANGVTWATISSLLVVLGVIAVIVVAVLALVYVFYLWKTGAIDTCDAIVSALMIVGIAVAIIGLLLGSWVIAIVGLVIAAIGLIIKYLDYFLAIVYSIGAAIYNIVIGCVNGIIQFIYTAFVEPFIGIIEWILNVCNGGFDSFGGAVANLIGQIIGWFLSLGTVVTKIIDAIFGTNWTDGLNSLRDKVLDWGKNETSITLSRDVPTVESLTGGALPDRIAYTDAWNTGMKHGAVAKDWMNNLGAKFQNQSKAAILPDPTDTKYDVTGSYNPSGADDDIANALDKISGNTDDIKDSMDLRDDDLEFLRRIADMEWRKEFTTAEIRIDMTNNNTVNSDRDLDGIVDYLADVLRDEMSVVAEGVHY